ncbi:MAG: PAS domain-containing protein [Rhodocyclaceae bacterium]|nr:PAS domain-containing protein [Rhodocyclaceae bacterium]
MEQLVVPTFVVDADCRVVIWNRACERLTGLKASEVIGTREQWRAFYTEPRPASPT